MTVIDAPPELLVVTRPSMTADELARASQSRTTELLNGEPVEKPVSAASSEAELWIGTRLTLFAMGTSAAKVFPGSMGYQVFQQVLPGDPSRVRKPDASVVRTDRILQLADPNPGYMPIVPDLAVEVMSPNDVWSDVVDKVHEYQAAGFPLVWIADPGFRTLIVHPAGGKPYMLSGDDEVTAESALPGFSCKASDLFPPAVARARG